jgi:hypothetical protein
MGKHQDILGQTACNNCTSGQYQDEEENNEACKSCEVGHFAAGPGWHDCSPCDPGTYHDEEGATYCKTCNYECPEGEFHDGCEGDSPGTCTSCLTGTFKGEASEDMCQDCAAGQFVDQLGATACFTCESGQFQDGLG